MEIGRDHLTGSSTVRGTSADGPVPAALPTGVVTFLLSDVEGSTRLWESDEGEMGTAIARHYEMLDSAIVLHNGVRPLEQGEGDSVVGVFARPSDAVAAALAAQRAFAEEAWPANRQLRIRVALHTGEAQLRGSDYYVGRTVIRCARLRALAHGGQTLLSASARDLLGERLPEEAWLCDLGMHRLKDLGAPERVFQLCHPDLPQNFPPLRSLDAVTSNLPVQLTSFVGREEELAQLSEVLRDRRFVTLTGAGGCGKTRLAQHAAADIAGRHPDGAWWVGLEAMPDPALIPATVARAFGLREDERPVIDTLCERVATIDALVILDNCEHVINACAELVERLLAAAPGLRILATSREPIGVPGEVTWQVRSLEAEAAVQLFVDRAKQVRPTFAPPDPEVAAIAGICRRLDGIPLAIELAAARIRLMSPTRIAAALDDRFRLLTGGRTSVPRQQTLELSVAWSHDLLDDAERALFRRLSVFVGGFSLETAEGVCGAAPLDPYAVLDVMSRLVDKSLVQVDQGNGEDRFWMLETIRLFAGHRLVDSGESESTRDAHLAFFLEFAERLEPQIMLADSSARLMDLEREHANFRAAMDWADVTGAHDSFLRLATALAIFWELHGHLEAGGRWFARALALDGPPSGIRARALWGAAHVAMYGGDFATLSRCGPAAVAMAEEVGDDRALARALNTIGVLKGWMLPEPASARPVLDRSIALAETIGDDWAIADGWKMMTFAWLVQDDYAGFEDANRELLRAAQRLNNKFFLGWYHGGLGWASVHRGDLATGRWALETALTHDEEIGGAATAGISLSFLAEIEVMTGQFQAAEERLGRFLARGVTANLFDAGFYPDVAGVVFALPAFGRSALIRGAPREALTLLEPVLEALRPIGFPLCVSQSLSVMGLAHLMLGDEGAAEAAYRDARGVGAGIDNFWLVAQADFYLGQLARHRGDLRGAESLHHAALAARAGRGMLPGVAESLEAVAFLAADLESYAEAARVLAAADALRTSIGLVRWPADQRTYDADLGRLRDAVDDDAFAAAWTAGTNLSVDDAVAYVSRARGERKRPSSGWAGLTPTEIEVVRLAAVGLTNPQIADRLFIGRGTVRWHLANIFAKLGVATRSELAAEATRRGL